MAEEINFSNYDNPEEAERIWNAYLPDVRDDLLEDAKGIVKSTKRATKLDILLDSFTSSGAWNIRRGPIDYF